MLRVAALTVLLAAPLLAQVPAGATREQVIQALGWPVSSSTGANREILNYPEYTVVLENGRVVSLQRKPTPAPSRPRPSTRPAAVPESTPQTPPRTPTTKSSTVVPTERSSASPPTNRPAPAKSAPSRTADGQKIPTSGTQTTPKTQSSGLLGALFSAFVIPLAIMATAAAGLVLVALKLRKREQNHMLEQPPGQRPEASRPADMQALRILARPSGPPPLTFSTALLKELEWHRFEHLVCALEAQSGHTAALTTFGADGGIDVTVTDKTTGQLRRIVQCKAFFDQEVGVQLIREFFGVMVHQNAPEGAYYTTSTFTSDARAFAVGKNLHLIDGPELLLRLSRLGAEAQSRLLAVATEGDYTTPTCPSCGIKLVYRAPKPGSPRPGFWGCTRYPRCQQRLYVRGPA